MIALGRPFPVERHALLGCRKTWRSPARTEHAGLIAAACPDTRHSLDLSRFRHRAHSRRAARRISKRRATPKTTAAPAQPANRRGSPFAHCFETTRCGTPSAICPRFRAGDAHRVIKSKSYDLPPLVLPYAAAIASISTSHSGSARLSTTASVLAGKCPASLNTRARIS